MPKRCEGGVSLRFTSGLVYTFVSKYPDTAQRDIRSIFALDFLSVLLYVVIMYYLHLCSD